MAREEYLSITEYGEGEDEKQKPACVIIDIHGGKPEDFLEEYPELARAVEVDEVTLLDYLDLEKDAGSTNVAHAVAQQIAGHQENLRAVVISILYPRGIIEPQRLKSTDAVKNVYKTEEHPELTAQFQGIHHRTQQTFHTTLENLLGKNPQAILVDMHTMASHNPRQQITVAPDLIGDYIQSFVDGQAYGAKRKIDIVTGRGKPNPRFSDEKLTTNMSEALTKAGYGCAENHPYFTLEGMTSDHLLQRYKGIGLDIPKDSLTISKPGDGVYSAICPDIDALRAVQIATPISSAILKTYFDRTM